jgi:Na+-translocating ferredoxin:NAD+ oxidoreductase RnfG subunit
MYMCMYIAYKYACPRERVSERERERSKRGGVRIEANTAAQIKSAAVVWALKKTVSSSTSHPLHI